MIKRQNAREQQRARVALRYAAGTTYMKETFKPFVAFSQAGVDYLKFYVHNRTFKKTK